MKTNVGKSKKGKVMRCFTSQEKEPPRIKLNAEELREVRGEAQNYGGQGVEMSEMVKVIMAETFLWINKGLSMEDKMKNNGEQCCPIRL